MLPAAERGPVPPSRAALVRLLLLRRRAPPITAAAEATSYSAAATHCTLSSQRSPTLVTSTDEI